jgi:hypothetical protein
MTHPVRVLGHDRLVYAHAGVVVDVTGFGHAHDGVDEHVRLTLTRCADCELAMGAVHWVARLEGDNLSPGNLLEMSAKLCRCI